MTTQSLIFSAAGASKNYWLSLSTNNGVAEDIAIDSLNNVYVVGRISDTTVAMVLMKYNPQGTVIWQRKLDGSGNDWARSITIDSSNNVYIIGYSNSGGFASDDIIIAKYDSNGSILWNKSIGTSNWEQGRGIKVFGSYVYITGTDNDKFFTAQLNASTGAINWMKTITVGENCTYNDIDVDSSGNVYSVGTGAQIPAGTNYQAIVTKFNSSGTPQFFKYLGTAAAQLPDEFQKCKIDSSDNLYAVGYWNNGTVYQLLLAKYNFSGTLLWQKSLAIGSSDVTYGFGVATDSSNNVYTCSMLYSGGEKWLVTKHNSNGTLQWQRILSNANGHARSMTIDSFGNMYIVGIINSSFAVLKVPSDGSQTGSFGPYNWQSSSLTDLTPTLTDSSSTYSINDSTLGWTNSPLSNSSTNYTTIIY